MLLYAFKQLTQLLTLKHCRPVFFADTGSVAMKYPGVGRTSLLVLEKTCELTESEVELEYYTIDIINTYRQIRRSSCWYINT